MFIVSYSFIWITLQSTQAKIVWKIKPQPYQLARENENVKINCEFENINPGLGPLANYFVIWYKDGASQNVLSLNDQLASPNSTNYEISGKYSLIIKNVTRNDSGQYTCQLFQSNDLVATVNLTVLVPPKYAKINVKQPNQQSSTNENYVTNKGYFIENDLIDLECCTNDDTNPEPRFEWFRVSRNNKLQTLIPNYSSVNNRQQVINAATAVSIKNNYGRNSGRLCNGLQLNLTRDDNNYYFKCSVINDALVNGKREDNFFISVEYKPEVRLQFKEQPSLLKLAVLEGTSIVLYCNSTAIPSVTNYDWYLNDQQITTSSRNTDSLRLDYLNREHAGNYSCKCTNRHGSSKAYFNVDVIFVQLNAINKTSEQRRLKVKDSIYLTSFENTSLSLQCEIKSYPQVDSVIWYFYQVNKTYPHLITHKVRLSNWISSIKTVLNETEKRYYSQLNLNNLTAEHTGYYSCSIHSPLVDQLNQTRQFNVNSTYFLQVKYAPELTSPKIKVYANDFDQITLKCQVKTNPIALITWYFESKEIFTNYKYNLTLIQHKQIDDAEFSDLNNVQLFESILTINSLTQYDYGEYMCRAGNQIGISSKIIRLNRKRKPDTPNDFKIDEVTSNSVQLSWLPPEYTGDNLTYILNINKTLNLTSFTDLTNETDSAENIIIAELKGLQTDTEYEFRVLSLNSMGSSEFSHIVRIRTLKTVLRPEQIPRIQVAKFSDIREAICFNLENSDYGNLKLLRDLIIRIDLKPHKSLQSFYVTNDTSNESLNSVKTILINVSKLKLGQNCIAYKQLIDSDLNQQKNSTSLLDSFNQNKKIVYSLVTTRPRLKSLQSVDSIGRNFFEFKRFNSINISVCYLNDSSICTEQIAIIDNSSEFSNYITLVAIGCSAVLIFIVLLISSLCCCCCRRRNKLEKKAANKMSTPNSKLNIKSFPVVLTHQQQQQINQPKKDKCFDFNDDCIKSSQQHIFNGSSSSSSSSSSSKNYYNTKNNIIEQNMYDPNVQKYMTNSYKMEYPQNTSSIATVESDVSSSISIENNNNIISKSVSNSKTSDLTHSPFALITDTHNKSIASSSYSNVVSSMSQKQSIKPNGPTASTLIYTGSGNMYIKTYQPQQSAQSSQYFNQKTILDNNPESGYSTPSNHLSKKLVYEVIV